MTVWLQHVVSCCCENYMFTIKAHRFPVTAGGGPYKSPDATQCQMHHKDIRHWVRECGWKGQWRTETESMVMKYGARGGGWYRWHII
jgi:hypothetical protein